MASTDSDFDVDLDLDLDGDSDSDTSTDSESDTHGSLAPDLATSPVLHTLLLMAVGRFGIWWSGLRPTSPWTAAPPVTDEPLTLVFAVYGHASTSHLVSNAVIVAFFGYLVARHSSTIRFHLFFVATGVVSGAITLAIHAARPIGRDRYLLGASGAAFALMGYVLAANAVSDSISSRLQLSRLAGVLVAVAVAIWLTLRFSGPGTAMIAHATGVLLGLAAGRLHLLRAR